MMYKKKRKIANTITLFTLLLVSIYGCNFREKKEKNTFYRAINGKDTAILSLSTYENRFWGQYEIRYGKMGKDSGEVRGEFIGDTLRGVYNYISYGGSLKQAPIALLKKNNKLLLGKGFVSSLMDMPIYVPEIPIDYTNSEFVFEEIKKSEKK
jgi:hypothetical protein